jgi:hypothetical protein
VAAAIGEAANHRVPGDEHIVYLHAGILDALEPLGHETDQSGPAELHEGAVVHIILREFLRRRD